MNSLKSTAVIVVLLGVLYGVYVTLNKPQSDDMSPAGTQSDSSPLDISMPPSSESAAGFSTGYNLGPASQQPSSGYASPATYQDPTTVIAAPPLDPQASRYGSDNSPATTYQPVDSATNLPAPPSNMSGDSIPEGDSGIRRSTYGAPAAEVPAMTDNAAPAGSGAPPLAEPSPETAPASTYGVSTTPPAQSMGSDVSDETLRNLAIHQLKQDMVTCEQMIAAGQFREALAILSPHHAKPELPAESREQLHNWLDSLAAKVIYSGEHLLADRYTTRGNESLFDIADKFQVPWQLLQNINGSAVSDPQTVLSGTTLKVVPGPFRAVVDLSEGEVTLYLKDLYAGRFPFELGDERPAVGDYQVADKRRDRTYYGKSGQTITGGDAANPYGGWWIDLGREASIHGSAARATPGATLGCVSLSTLDAKDVYSILSIGSEVAIRP